MTDTVIFLDSKKGKGKSSNFTIKLNPPVILNPNKDYMVALVNSELWYSWYNVTTSNNNFKYFNGTDWVTVKVPPGAYNIKDINEEIKNQINDEGDNDEFVTLTANFNTSKTILRVNDNYKVDFDIDDGLRDLLGYDGKTLSAGRHIGDKQINITNIHTVLIKCSLVSSSYLNGSTSDVIFNFSPNLPPGSLLSVQPNQLLYIPISRTEQISSITMKVTNQDDEEIEFNGERTTFFIAIKDGGTL